VTQQAMRQGLGVEWREAAFCTCCCQSKD